MLVTDTWATVRSVDESTVVNCRAKVSCTICRLRRWSRLSLFGRRKSNERTSPRCATPVEDPVTATSVIDTEHRLASGRSEPQKQLQPGRVALVAAPCRRAEPPSSLADVLRQVDLHDGLLGRLADDLL